VAKYLDIPGSGRVKIASGTKRAPTLKRETPAVAPTLSDLVSEFWDSVQGVGFSPRLIDRVWAANRCVQLNSQQVSAMPLRFFGPPSTTEPAWLSSPDPAWFPNGVGDAVFAAVNSYYGWGDAFLLVTSRYADGFPRAWTVLDPERMHVDQENGRRTYRLGEQPLDADDVIQISRDPRGGLRGTSALQAYASPMYSAIASSDLSRTIMNAGTPTAVLKSQRKLTGDQAVALQNQWIEATAVRRGAPAVLPPEIDFEQLAFSPKDLMLLDLQEYDARRIASAFGVPPFLLNLPLEGGLTYQNPAMLFETWWRTELRPAANRISMALTANMLPRGQWVEFDARDVLAPDFGELVLAWEKILAFGGGSIGEFRADVLRQPPQSDEEAIADTLTPAAAGANTQVDASNVLPMKPAQTNV
jgi:HK97 family phage portal protein